MPFMFQEVMPNQNPTHPYFKEWQEKARSGDEQSIRLIENYSTRPAEELYDCKDDPWNLNNIAADQKLDSVKSRLSEELDAWMKRQGDQGQATELAAEERQTSSRKR